MSKKNSTLRSFVTGLFAVCTLSACEGPEYEDGLAEEELLVAELIDGEEASAKDSGSQDMIHVSSDDGVEMVVPLLPDAQLDELSGNSAPKTGSWNYTVQQGQYMRVEGQKAPGVTYRFCITPTDDTDPDAYGHYAGKPKTNWYQFRSIKGSGKTDCIQFTATQWGKYYYAAYGYTWSNFEASLTAW